MSYLEIAQRGKTEMANAYTVLCLGLQSYLSVKRLASR